MTGQTKQLLQQPGEQSPPAAWHLAAENGLLVVSVHHQHPLWGTPEMTFVTCRAKCSKSPHKQILQDPSGLVPFNRQDKAVDYPGE